MTEVLIRDVPEDDLGEFRDWARSQGMSVPAALRQYVHTQAAAARQRRALAEVERALAAHGGGLTHDQNLETLHEVREEFGA
jgi:hypothetical protein